MNNYTPQNMVVIIYPCNDLSKSQLVERASLQILAWVTKSLLQPQISNFEGLYPHQPQPYASHSHKGKNKLYDLAHLIFYNHTINIQCDFMV